MKTCNFLIFLILALISCDQIKQAAGQLVVSVENATEIDDFEIFANGQKQFNLDAGDKKSFSVSGLDTGSIRVVIRHRTLLSSDLVFTLINSESGGGSAKLLISTEISFGREVVVVTCPGCESRGKSNPIK